MGSGDFTPSYSNGTLVISASSVEFSTSNTYKLVYTYNGSSSNIDTKEVQVGSGATSITFTGLEAEPDYFSCIFKSYFNTSSGYQRVIVVANDGSDTYGMEMDSSAKYSDAHWSYSYSNGSLTITSQGTNAGGYFHQPGYYQLTYGYSGDSGGANYQTKTVTPTTSQQVVTADSGYDALEQVTVNAIPSQYIVPSGNLAITQNGNNINVAQYSTVSVSVESSGGSSNIVEGTFTTGSSAGVSSVTIPYTGSGYPISCIVVVEGGAYNSAISGWYNSMQRYAVGQWTMTKAVFTSSPTYTTSGTQNQGVTTWVYKNSTSSSTSYSRSSAMNTNAFSSSNASNAGATCVRLKSGNVLSYYVNTSSYGLLPDTTYRYIITYSS